MTHNPTHVDSVPGGRGPTDTGTLKSQDTYRLYKGSTHRIIKNLTLTQTKTLTQTLHTETYNHT